jgi:hypothetical protein
MNMNFNRIVKTILNEAGGYIAQTSKARNVDEAVKELQDNFKQLQKNAELLKIHPDRYEIDSDSYRRTVDIINTLNQWGDRIKDAQGRSINRDAEVKRALDMSNRPEHDKNTITSETKLTAWKPLYRKWFALYSKFMDFKAVNRRSMDTQQTPDANEIFYFGSDGLPYVTRMSFDAQGNVEGIIFHRTNRFADTQIDQIKDPTTGKPVKPIKFEKGKQSGTIPLNANIERVFGQPEISKNELQTVLNSPKAEKAFKQRIARDPKLKAWYDKKYSKVIPPNQPK